MLHKITTYIRFFSPHVDIFFFNTFPSFHIFYVLNPLIPDFTRKFHDYKIIFSWDIFVLQPIDVLRNLKESLVSDKLATAESGKAFIELLRTFRNTGKLTIEEILTNTDSYYIV